MEQEPRPSRLPSQPRPRGAAAVRAVGAGPPLALQRSLGRAARADCEVIARGRKERAVAEPLFRRGAWRGERAGRSGPRAGGKRGHGEQDGGRAPGADGGRGGLGGGAARGLRARAPLAVPARVPAAQCGRAAGGGQRRAAAPRLALHGVGQPRLPGLPVSCAAGGGRVRAAGWRLTALLLPSPSYPPPLPSRFRPCRYPPQVTEKALEMAEGIQVTGAPVRTTRDELVAKVKKRGISSSNG